MDPNIQFSEEDDSDDSFSKEFSTPQQSVSADNSNCSAAVRLLTQQKLLDPFTSLHQKINEDITALVQMDLNDVYQTFNNKIMSLYNHHIAGRIKQGESNDEIFNNFTSESYQYLIKDAEADLCKMNMNQNFHHYLRKMFMDMTSELMSSEAKKMAKETISRLNVPPVPPDSSTDGGASLSRLASKTLDHLGKQYKKLVQKYQGEADLSCPSYNRINHLNACVLECRCSIAGVEAGSRSDTTKSTSKRPRREVQITDEFYQFFCELNNTRQRVETIGNGLLLGPTIFKHSYQSLLADASLKDLLCGCVSSRLSGNAEGMEEFYNDILKRYLVVCHSIYRKTLLAHFQGDSIAAYSEEKEAKSGLSTSQQNKRTARDYVMESDDDECQSIPCKAQKSNIAADLVQ